MVSASRTLRPTTSVMEHRGSQSGGEGKLVGLVLLRGAACDKGRSLVDALNSPEAANPAFRSLDSYLLEGDRQRLDEEGVGTIHRSRLQSKS